MTERKAFPLRLDPGIYDELQRWAGAELRSLNGQIEYLLRNALRDAGRLPRSVPEDRAEAADAGKKRQKK